MKNITVKQTVHAELSHTYTEAEAIEAYGTTDLAEIERLEPDWMDAMAVAQHGAITRAVEVKCQSD